MSNTQIVNDFFLKSLVKTMLNPNSDMYIKRFNETEFCKGLSEDNIKIVKSAKEIAEIAILRKENKQNNAKCTCPECGCQNYVNGVACPNCEYIGE